MTVRLEEILAFADRQRIRLEEAQAEVERLKALAQEPWSSKTYASVVAEVVERAAAIAEEFLCLEAAHAIRAEIK